MDDNFKNEIIEKLLSSRIENDSQAQSCIKSTENSKFIKLLPFEELIKALDARGAEYDKHELEEAYFLSRGVILSRGVRHLSYGIRYPQAPVPMTNSSGQLSFPDITPFKEHHNDIDIIFLWKEKNSVTDRDIHVECFNTNYTKSNPVLFFTLEGDICDFKHYISNMVDIYT